MNPYGIILRSICVLVIGLDVLSAFSGLNGSWSMNVRRCWAGLSLSSRFVCCSLLAFVTLELCLALHRPLARASIRPAHEISSTLSKKKKSVPSNTQTS